MKKFIDSFRDIRNHHLGYMLIPQHYYAGDKQLHTLRGIITGVSFYILKYEFDFNWNLAVLFSFLFTVGIAYANEFRQKGIHGRVFSHKDVVADVIGWFIQVIIFGTFVYSL